MKTILWFRRDLRVDDNMLLSIKADDVLPIFIFDKNILDFLSKDDKRVDYIFKMIKKLKDELEKIGLYLNVFYSSPKEVFTYLKNLGYSKVYASIDYDSYAISRDKQIEKIMPLKRLNDSYIYDANELLKDDGSAYVVFAPYFNLAKKVYVKEHALEYKVAKNKQSFSFDFNFINHVKGDILEKLDFDISSIGFIKNDIVYEDVDLKLEKLKKVIGNYKEDRDFLYINKTSNLSLELRFGTISIRKILRYLVFLKKQGFETQDFFRQLVFRDFYAYLLYHYPKLEKEDFKVQVPYKFNEEYYKRFINAKTGIPIIDAAITQLISTGYMHNRARMIVSSFFCKHLMLPWQKAEEFFAKYLMDYDAASNILSWQWSASTGIDAQPYFRIFNPYTQSKKFDKDAIYIKKYLPFLNEIDAKNLHNEEFLFSNDIENYVKPIVNHKFARERFLQEVKKHNK